jgi:hypothetical protein
MGSIRKDDIAHYFESPDRYDVAVKRFSKEWFQNDDDLIDKSYRQEICDIALSETVEKFDARFIKVFRRLLRQIKLVYRYTRRKIKYPRFSKKRGLPIIKHTKHLKISSYSCGGFIQWCYYQGISRMLKDSKDQEKLRDVIFNDRGIEPMTHHDLLCTNPADLAKSNKLSWEYIIKDGVVWEVQNEKEVEYIIKSRN